MNAPLRMHDIIDSAALRRQLALIASKDRPGPTSQTTHNHIITPLKQALSTGRKACEQMLLKDGGGTLCARRLSHLTDTIIEAVYDFTITKIYPLHNPSSGEKIALVAVGGYGRGTLAPGSDIDLLFLLPWKQTPWGEQVMEYILRLLWDTGLKVGHATRNLQQTIHMARQDMTVRTTLLEMRFLAGNRALFHDLTRRFEADVIKGTAAEFIRAKLLERDRRHKKAGETRYLVEPNVKQSKGGQRDLQTLFWITKYYYRIRSLANLVKIGVLSRQEARIFRKADNFLWSVRAHMHFVAGKAQERLSFDVQREIAHRLGYKDHPGLKDVERFMKQYFLVAKQVGDLSRIISSALEEEHAKAFPGLSRHAGAFSRQPMKIKEAKGFIVDNNRISITGNQVFAQEPVNLIRIFHLADIHGLAFHPYAMQQVARSLRLVNARLRKSKTANALFLDILTSPRNPALMLRRMNESGVLGKFIPDFGRIVAMMQFNMYHHYTVDEHLLHCSDQLSRLEKRHMGKQHPLADSLVPALKSARRVLYVATFLHDIAKGRPENHAIAGEKIARRLCPRLGLTQAETGTVAWLVREHLTMSMVAQSRDLNDHKTITDFAEIVHTTERLKLLLILTICDIRGVGPGVWNGWKGQLLRTLYYETELVLTGGFSKLPRTERLEAARRHLAEQLAGWDEDSRQNYLALHYPNYWLTVAAQDQLRHACFIAEANRNNKSLDIMVRLLAFEAVTEITVFAPDHQRLLSVITGACAAAGANIVDAQIFTTSDGRALDIIRINREFIFDDDESRRANRVGTMIRNVVEGKTRLPEMIRASRSKMKRATKAFVSAPRIEIDNTLSDKFSVIKVKGIDRPGLLSELTAELSNLSLNIASAHINTFGEKVIDSFYVTDNNGNQITRLKEQQHIRHRLLGLFDHASGRDMP